MGQKNIRVIFIVAFIVGFFGLTGTSLAAADPNANAKAKAILAWLTNLPNQSTNRLVAGQHTYMYDNLISTIHNNTGKYVGLSGIDYFYENNTSTNNQAATWFNTNHALITVCHHLNNPKTGGDAWDTNFTDSDMDSLITNGTSLNTTFNGVLNSIASGLTTLQNAGVVVLYRPFHEQDGGWFWWGGKTPAKMIALWKYVFNYMTTTKDLHNLIWVWNTNGGLTWSYYPGSAYVDIVSADLYGYPPNAAVSGYSSLSTYGKPFALGEYGPCGASGCTSAVDMRNFLSGVKSNMPKTVYWMEWAENFSLAYHSNVSDVFNDPWVVTADDIPTFSGGGDTTPPSPPARLRAQ